MFENFDWMRSSSYAPRLGPPSPIFGVPPALIGAAHRIIGDPSKEELEATHDTLYEENTKLKMSAAFAERSHNAEVDRLKKRRAELETENTAVKSGGGDDRAQEETMSNDEIMPVIVENEPPTRKIEFKCRSGIEAKELADLVNDGWEIDYRCYLTPPSTVGLFVVLRRWVK